LSKTQPGRKTPFVNTIYQEAVMTRSASFAVITVQLLSVSAFSASTYFSGRHFSADLLGKNRCTMNEQYQGSRPTIYVGEGQEYSIRVYNPLPVRVAVAVSVDGLNTIDGGRTKPSRAAKWIIEPYSSVTIDGWQTSTHSLRRFVFTNRNRSYASGKEKRDRAEYTRNLGVIGVAWFWNGEELADALRPVYSYEEQETDKCESAAKDVRGAATKSPAACRAPERKAGTGMGSRQQNRVTRVKFEYDTGMYDSDDVLKIFYEFGPEEPEPQPFEEEDRHGFAPEMR
jgi:hypothetical protein